MLFRQALASKGFRYYTASITLHLGKINKNKKYYFQSVPERKFADYHCLDVRTSKREQNGTEYKNLITCSISIITTCFNSELLLKL
jgi:hypothetical protein